MNALKRCLPAVLGLLSLAGAAFATETIALKSGKVLRGEVLESTPDRMRFQFHDGVGLVTVGLTSSQVTPHSWYNVRAPRVGDDASAHLALAQFCIENGLYHLAENQLREAVELDSSLAEEAEEQYRLARDGAAKKLVELAKEALEKGELVRAERLVATVVTRYRGASVHAAAVEMLDDIGKKKAQLESEQVVAAEKALEKQAREERENKLAEPMRALERGRTRNVAGLRSDNLSRSQRAYAAAIAEYQRGLRELEPIEKREAGQDRELGRMISELRQRLSGEVIQSHINMGSEYLVSGSFKTALHHANLALATDTSDRDARAFRARVEYAAAEAARGGYRWRSR